MPVTFVPAENAEPGVRVEIVDAVTDAVVTDAQFRWVRAVKEAAPGSYRLPRGVHWYEVEGPGIVRRREAYDHPGKPSAGVLRIPVLPRVLLIQGRLPQGLSCVVEAPAALSLAPLSPPTVEADPEGNFALLVRAPTGPCELQLRLSGRSAVVAVPTEVTGQTDRPPHFDIPTVVVDTGVELTEHQQAAVQWYRERIAAKNRHAPSKSWVAASDAGLAWLAAHQDEDGRWDADRFMKHDKVGEPCDAAGPPLVDVGVTGLALLAFLGDGHTAITGRYAQNVRRAVEWLLQQRITDDLLNATDLDVIPGNHIYQHGIAAQALCLACALGGDEGWRTPVQRVVDYLELHRNPYGVWSYQNRSGDNRMSSTLWAALAVVAARDSGFQVEPKSLDYAASFVDEMTDPMGRTGYVTRGGLSGRRDNAHDARFPADRNETMTAAGLVVRAALGLTPGDRPQINESIQLLTKRPPRWDRNAGTIDFYAWALGTRALWMIGANARAGWSKTLAQAVLPNQREDGNFAGSWDPVHAWGESGGRVYSTAILVWALQSPWAQ